MKLSYIKGSLGKGYIVRTIQSRSECHLEMIFEVGFFSKTVGARKDEYKRVFRSAAELIFLESWRERMYSPYERESPC